MPTSKPAPRRPASLQAEAEARATQEYERRLAEIKALAPLLARLDELRPALDDAVAAYLTHSSGHADPLTAATLDQCTQPAPLDTHLDAAPRRAGWEAEPIDVPTNWRFLAVVALCALFASVLVACGGSQDDPSCPDPRAAIQPVDCKACPEQCA